MFTSVCLLGPPGAGKSSLARRLVEGPAVRLFRLRAWVPTGALTDADGRPVSWIDDDVVSGALDLALPDARRDGVRLLVLDNFPRTPAQVDQILERAPMAPPTGVIVMHLQVSVPTALRRVGGRLVCPGCEADPLGDARFPAAASEQDPSRCRVCRGLLVRRPNDSSPHLAARIRLYHALAESTFARFREHGVGIHHIEAERRPEAVERDVRAVLAAMLTRRQSGIRHDHRRPARSCPA
jgi:adenylate kinase